MEQGCPHNSRQYWDSQNRLASCTYNGQTATFTYGADGLRRSVASGGVTTDFILDGQSAVREMRGGTKYATYLAGLRGVEYRRDDATGVLRWYIYDGLGSVLGEVNTAGEVVDSSGTPVPLRKLDVYGAQRGTPIQSTGNHKFVGSLRHATEDNTGLIYMRARYYDPAIGRFISEDPGRNGANWYVYCENSPTGTIDPSGRVPEWVNHVFGDDEFGRLAFEAAKQGGEAFLEFIEENFQGIMNVTRGCLPAIAGRYMLRMLVDSALLDFYAEVGTEIGVGEFLAVEEVEGLLGVVSSGVMVDMEEGVTVAFTNATMGVD